MVQWGSRLHFSTSLINEYVNNGRMMAPLSCSQSLRHSKGQEQDTHYAAFSAPKSAWITEWKKLSFSLTIKLCYSSPYVRQTLLCLLFPINPFKLWNKKNRNSCLSSLRKWSICCGQCSVSGRIKGTSSTPECTGAGWNLTGGNYLRKDVCECEGRRKWGLVLGQHTSNKTNREMRFWVAVGGKLGQTD